MKVQFSLGSLGPSLFAHRKEFEMNSEVKTTLFGALEEEGRRTGGGKEGGRERERDKDREKQRGKERKRCPHTSCVDAGHHQNGEDTACLGNVCFIDFSPTSRLSTYRSVHCNGIAKKNLKLLWSTFRPYHKPWFLLELPLGGGPIFIGPVLVPEFYHTLVLVPTKWVQQLCF